MTLTAEQFMTVEQFMTLTVEQFEALTREFEKLVLQVAALEASVASLLAPRDPYGPYHALENPYFQDGNRFPDGNR